MLYVTSTFSLTRFTCSYLQRSYNPCIIWNRWLPLISKILDLVAIMSYFWSKLFVATQTLAWLRCGGNTFMLTPTIPGYQDGKEYVYKFESQVLTGLPTFSKQYSGIKVVADVKMLFQDSIVLQVCPLSLARRHLSSYTNFSDSTNYQKSS